MKKKVLITGATGFLGRHFHKKLKENKILHVSISEHGNLLEKIDTLDLKDVQQCKTI